MARGLRHNGLIALTPDVAKELTNSKVRGTIELNGLKD